MAYYNYKRVIYRDDYAQAKREIEARDSEEYEDSVDYDGEAWCVVEFLLDKYKARITELEEFQSKAFEAHSNIDRDIELLGS